MHKVKLLFKQQSLQKYLSIIESVQPPNLLIDKSNGEDADIVFGEPSLIRDQLPELHSVKWVQSSWAGVEPLLSPSLRRNYQLTNARGVFGGLMSEYVFGYLLMHERKILPRFYSQQKSEWNNSLPGTLRGKTIGIMGTGSIGLLLAKTARHFGMRVLGYSRNSETCEDIERYYHGDDITEFASHLDILINVLPNTKYTTKIVNERVLSALPKNSVFINAGRGSTLDETALLQAIEQNHFAMVVLDVFEQEPLPPKHPLWHAKNVYISSHTAAPSIPEDICKLFFENYKLFSSGQPLKFLVDFDLGY